jgi:hypothetical protein
MFISSEESFGCSEEYFGNNVFVDTTKSPGVESDYSCFTSPKPGMCHIFVVFA